MVVRGRVRGVASALALVCSSSVQAAAAQSVAAQSGPRFELGAQFVAAASSEFDTDRGVSVGLALRPVSLWSAEGEIAFYPSAYPDQSEFSRSRVEGLFGVGVGPLVGRLRPFAKARAGFLTYRAASDPIVCIAIFPPPLRCVLAAGKTIPAFDLGGGVVFYPTPRTFVRIDLSDRILRYPGPTFDLDGEVRDESFSSDGFRVAAGGGVRF